MTLYSTTRSRVKNSLSAYRLRPHFSRLVIQSIVACGGTVRIRWVDWPAPCSGKPPLTIVIGGRP